VCAAPAFAQFAGTAVVASDDMFRGRSTTDHNPALTVGVSYDHSSGLYAGGSITATAGNNVDPRIGAGTQYAGYARPVGRLSLDIGVVHRSYTRLYTAEYARDYTEGYVGISGRDIGTRFYLCPDFDGHGKPAAYAEVNATVFSDRYWTMSGHAGALRPPREHDTGQRTTTFDGRVSVARRLGPVSMSFDMVGLAHREGGNDSARVVLSVSGAF